MQRLISSEQAIGGMMMEHKRCPITFEESSITTLTPKRHKADLSLTSKKSGGFCPIFAVHVDNLPIKRNFEEKKEKVGERIAALQQLVSPYGKTDTASVLLEAMEYITFLHEQVKVLSAPYLCGSPTSNTLDPEPYNLRSKGLCLVPVSCTIGVASSNGADIWAPIKTSSPKF